MDFLKKGAENNAVAWDVATVTAADYTLEFDLPPTFYKEWDESVFLEYSAEQSYKRGSTCPKPGCKEADPWTHPRHAKCKGCGTNLIHFEGFASRIEAFRDWI
jgi:hypothetical protein